MSEKTKYGRIGERSGREKLKDQKGIAEMMKDRENRKRC